MKNTLLIIIFLINSLILSAQRIDGHISERDSKGNTLPLTGVNLYWLGTSIGTTTNTEGYFVMDRSTGSTRLVISFVGFATDTLTIDPKQTHIMHTLSSSISIEGVLVKGTTPGAHFDRLSPIQTQVITKNELKRAACCNLSESFETNASVDVSYSDAVTGAKQIQLLGLAGTYSQIQVENIPALRGLASTFGLGHIPGSWMESIQVSKGTASVANGYESISGQINVEYKKPWEEERFFVNGYANSLGMAEANSNISIDISPKISTMILAHFENMSEKVDHNHDSFLDHPTIKQYHILNRWKYQGENLESQLGIRVLDEDRVSGQSQSTHITNPFGISIRTKQIEGFNKTGYIFERPATTIGLITAASQHDQQSIFGSTSYSGTQQSVFANLIFLTYLGNTNHTIKTGISLVYDDIHEKLNELNLERQDVVAGAYLEYTYKWLEKLTFVSGIRADNHNKFGNIITPRVHLLYKPIEQISIRTSAGKGYRNPNVIAENTYLLASSRNLVFNEDIRMEEAWNIGINLLQRYKIAGKDLTISTDYYHTSFVNQLIVDMEQNPFNVYFYNLDGKSYSKNFQVEAAFKPMNRFEVTLAYRLNDVRSTIDGKLIEKPLSSRYKGFVSTSYKTPLRKWQFDYTVHLNGGGRLPSTALLPLEFQRGETFPSFITMNAQITKYFRKWDAYIGVENLTGFTQLNPIISPENPYSPFFDASMVWGPISGRKFYFGFRYSLARK
jgi:outer membrane cobalamin receptor